MAALDIRMAIDEGREDEMREQYGDEAVDEWFGQMWGADPELMRSEAAAAGLDEGAMGVCCHCSGAIAYDKAEESWRHVREAPAECWMVHGNGATLDAKTNGGA